jgi:hypothetical protein
MDVKLKRRLEKAEEKIGMNGQKVLVKVWPDDESNHDDKIERWKNGEEVDGIDGKYQGGEVDPIYIKFVRSPNSRANGEKDPNMP